MKNPLPKLFQEVWFRYVFSIALVGLIAVAWLVYPTPYRFLYLNEGGDVSPVRVHRVTGTTEILYSDGWKIVDPDGPEEADSSQGVLPESETAKLGGSFRFDGESLKIEIYNGSNWSINEILVRVKLYLKTDNSLILDRQYRLTGLIDPLETDSLSDYVGFTPGEIYRVEYETISVSGFPGSLFR